MKKLLFTFLILFILTGCTSGTRLHGGSSWDSVNDGSGFDIDITPRGDYTDDQSPSPDVDEPENLAPSGAITVVPEDITADSLLSSGYGVANIQSATLKLTCVFDDGITLFVEEGVYEQDQSATHLLLVESTLLGDASVDQDVYYSIRDSVFYTMIDNEWVSAGMNAEEVDIGKWWNLSTICEIEQPQVYALDGAYIVVGHVSDSVCLGPVVIVDGSSAVAYFVYDCETLELQSIRIGAVDSYGSLYLYAEVCDINETVVTLPSEVPYYNDDEPWND